MKAILKNYRQSPRKVRLVGDLLKGKNIQQAQDELKFLPKRASLAMKKLLDSAVANAKQNNIAVENLQISNIRIDKGVVLKRSMPRARGSASRINKRTSHVLLTLVEKIEKIKKKDTKIKIEEKEEVTKVIKTNE